MNQSKETKTKTHSEKLQKILEINKKINASSNFREVISAILFSAIDLINTEGGSLLLSDDTGKFLTFEIVVGESKGKLEGLKIPSNKGIAGYIFTNNTPVISNDTENDPRFFGDVDKVSGMKTKKLLGVPLVKGGIVIGVIEVVNKVDGRDFVEDDLEILSIFAEQAAIAINNASLIKDLDQKARELAYLYDISNYTISSIPDRKNLFKKIVSVLSEISGADRISIMLFDESTRSLYIEACIGIDDSIVGSVRVDVNDISRPSAFVFSNGYYIFVKDMDTDGRFGRNKRLRYKSKSFISFPIKSQGKIVGVINITEFKEGLKIEQDDIGFLEVVSNQVGFAYDSVRMYEDRIQMEAWNRELEITRQIQMDLIPKSFNFTNLLDVHFALLPHYVVGGDFYDVYKLSENEICFFLGDVSGKGLPASIFMAASKSIIKAFSYEFKNPKRILDLSNLVLCESSESSMFATVFIGIIDMGRMSLAFSNAGHGQQFLVRGDKVINLYTKGLPVGIFNTTNYQFGETNLQRGDIIVVYSDGISESINDNNELFGEQRIIETIVENKHLTSKEIIDHLLRKVDEFSFKKSEYGDDISIGVIKVL
jgi:serine phosphatase RsbU (regulator of sigma subunit)